MFWGFQIQLNPIIEVCSKSVQHKESGRGPIFQVRLILFADNLLFLYEYEALMQDYTMTDWLLSMAMITSF